MTMLGNVAKSIMSSSVTRSMTGRAVDGAALGALMGSDKGWRGALEGAAIGGGVAAFGGKAAGWLGRRYGISSIAGGMAGGLRHGARAFGRAGAKIATAASNRAVAGNLNRLQANMSSFGVNSATSAAKGFNTASRFIGRNRQTINKYGGVAFGAIGVASAAHIGSSVLASNRAANKAENLISSSALFPNRGR